MRKITPFLWYENQAEEAANFYASVFPNSHIDSVVRNGEAGPGPAGSAMTVAFTLDGNDFLALNGGPEFKFTPAISFVVPCETQAEIDHLWDHLSEGGSQQDCGWLQDRYGVSWQIVPTEMGTMMTDPDPVRSQRVMRAMLQMKKLDISRLREAYSQT